ncbi:DUF6625 family protein [Vibrio sp. 10N.247.311.59]|uniref:DUF6625 family protein n=1 Tax=Vibrio sp. 10N.247.311.59 TaxID=3229989 RepID=UPI00354E387C
MKLIFILPYYGAFPNYFDIWLKTAGYNKKFPNAFSVDLASHSEEPPRFYYSKIKFKDVINKIQRGYVSIKFKRAFLRIK